MVSDVILAYDDFQREQLWKIRENAAEAQKRESSPVNTDISVTCDSLQEFYNLATDAVRSMCSKTRICCYGHMGDGNLHFNLIEQDGGDKNWDVKSIQLTKLVYDALYQVNGSISAEHGIGSMKMEQLKFVKDGTSLSIMANLKRLFDPKDLLNPGKVIDYRLY